MVGKLKLLQSICTLPSIERMWKIKKHLNTLQLHCYMDHHVPIIFSQQYICPISGGLN